MARGGRRPGAGRPKTEDPKQQIPIYVSGDLAEYMRERGPTQVVEADIPKTKAFRDWLRARKKLS